MPSFPTAVSLFLALTSRCRSTTHTGEVEKQLTTTTDRHQTTTKEVVPPAPHPPRRADNSTDKNYKSLTKSRVESSSASPTNRHHKNTNHNIQGELLSDNVCSFAAGCFDQSGNSVPLFFGILLSRLAGPLGDTHAPACISERKQERLPASERAYTLCLNNNGK